MITNIMCDVGKEKTRIVVLYGGVGTEREVSLVSGVAVIDALKRSSRYQTIGIRLDENALPTELDPSKDFVLLVLHGEYGEDGTIQSELEARGIQFAGCGSTSSRLCMDKVETKKTISKVGVPVVPGLLYDGQSADEIRSKLGNQLIAKPVSMGSSVDLKLIDTDVDLDLFISNHGYDQQWLIEQRIFGREFSIGVLKDKAMGIVEIVVPSGRVYDYEQKYHRNDTCYECPAKLSEDETVLVQDLALKVFVACGCRDYARIDFLRDDETGQWYCLELNTLPGMTPSSLLPKSAGAIGLNFLDLIEAMVESAGSHGSSQ